MAYNAYNEQMSPRAQAQAALRELSRRYEEDPDQFSDNDAEYVARAAFESGIPFEPESKKTEKFFFDLADTALLGLIPNAWRPQRVAEEIYGESSGERFVGDMAGLIGLLIPGYGMYKGIGALKKSERLQKAGSYVKQSRPAQMGKRGLVRYAVRACGGVGNVGGF